MEEALQFDGKTYISSKRAAQLSGYTKDYIGQLCRGGKLDAKLIGRNWYIAEGALEETQKRRNYVIPEQQAGARTATAEDSAEHSTEVECANEPEHASDPTESQTEVNTASANTASENTEEHDGETGLEDEGSSAVLSEEESEEKSDSESEPKAIPTDLPVSSEDSNEGSDVPIIAPDHAISLRDELAPATIESLAMTRQPTRFELDKKFRQDALLTDMHVVYEDGMPVFFNDDRPLVPTPDRSGKAAEKMAGHASQKHLSESSATLTRSMTPATAAQTRQFATKFNGVYRPKKRRTNTTGQPAKSQPVIEHLPLPTSAQLPKPAMLTSSAERISSQESIVSPISSEFDRKSRAEHADSASLKVAASILFLAVAVAGAIAVFSMSRVSDFENVATPEQAFYEGRN